MPISHRSLLTLSKELLIDNSFRCHGIVLGDGHILRLEHLAISDLHLPLWIVLYSTQSCFQTHICLGTSLHGLRYFLLIFATWILCPFDISNLRHGLQLSILLHLHFLLSIDLRFQLGRKCYGLISKSLHKDCIRWSWICGVSWAQLLHFIPASKHLFLLKFVSKYWNPADYLTSLWWCLV